MFLDFDFYNNFKFQKSVNRNVCLCGHSAEWHINGKCSYCRCKKFKYQGHLNKHMKSLSTKKKKK